MRLDYSCMIGVRKGIIEIVGVHGRVNGAMKLIGKCDCGTIKTFDASNFRRGKQLSCGCNRSPKRVIHNYKHPLYKIWISMRARCNNENDHSYGNYGGRGVKVCEQWEQSYQSFFDWCMGNGWKQGMFVDKDIKGDGLTYSPETCSIVTRTENNRHTRAVKLTQEQVVEIKQLELKTSEICKIYNLTPSYVRAIKRNSVWK